MGDFSEYQTVRTAWRYDEECKARGFEDKRVKNLSSNPNKRKAVPMARGLLDYFPLALAAVAELSMRATQQHHPDKEMHWDKSKSTDHADCIIRHLVDRGALDSDGISHTTKMAWRALALLQTELEAGFPMIGGGRNSHSQCRDDPVNGADILFEAATGCAGERNSHPQCRNGRPGRRADEQGESMYKVEQLTQTDVQTPAAKPPCSCLEGCVIDRGGVPPKHVYCCRAEAIALSASLPPRTLKDIRERGV